MLDRWISQRVVALCGRYIWRGRLADLCEPLIRLTEASQVIDHGADILREEHHVGEVVLNLMAVESIYLEEGLAWIPKSQH